MAVNGGTLGITCGEQNYVIRHYYDSNSNMIACQACFYSLSLPNSFGPLHTTTYYIDFLPTYLYGSLNSLSDWTTAEGNYGFGGVIMGVTSGYVYNISANETRTPNDWRTNILPNINGYSLMYWEQETPTGGGSAKGNLHTLTVQNNVPGIPSVPVFTIVDDYDGVDCAKICITNGSTNVTYWKIYRSATSGGVYTQIGTVHPSNGTCFYDDNVVTGQTWWYKVSAYNQPWDELSAAQSHLQGSIIDNTCVIRNKASITNVFSGDTGSRYELWRSATENGTYQRVGVTFSGGSDVYDKVTVYGATYWYKVKQYTPYWSLTGISTQVQSILTMPDAPVLSGVLDTGTTSVDLSWTDSNVVKQLYEVYKQTASGGSYVLIGTTTGTTFHASGLTVNVFYRFRIRGRVDCFAPTYIYSPYSNFLEFSIFPVIFPPTGVTSTSITCTGATISWVNNNISGITGNRIRKWNGADYDTIATLPSGYTAYVATLLTPFTNQIFIVQAFNIGRTAPSNPVSFTTLDPAPFNLNGIINYLQCAFTWNVNDPPYGISIRPEIRLASEMSWTAKPVVAKNATSYTFTGLTFGTDYEARFVRVGTEYPSITYPFSTTAFLAPTDLHATSVGDKQICIAWTNHTSNDGLDVFVRKEAEAWVLYDSVPDHTTNICVTGLTMGTLYSFVVINNYGIYTLSSNQIQETTTVTFLPAFCANQAFLVIDTTCGNSTGRIEMNEDYTIFYTFTLTDSFGNSYTLTDYFWSGLTAGWYEITATVLPKWYYHYGNESCFIDWVPLYDTDTTLTLTAVKVKNAVCGGFGDRAGRIVYQFTDSSNTVTGLTFTLWNDRHQTIDSQSFSGSSFTGNTNIIVNAPPDLYYGIVEDSNGCTYLIDSTFVDSERLFTVEGVARLFLTPWNIGLSYNYFSDSDEDWYVTGIDSESFTSAKISEFENLIDFWYEIKLQSATMAYNQNLVKDQNGLRFAEEVTIVIQKQENAKWKELVDILTQRYVLVFQDNHGQYWTVGYQRGCEARGYKLATNAYQLTFTTPSTTKLLTSLDETYVKNNIL